MGEANFLKEIDEFESHYQYACTYLRELLTHSPAGNAGFLRFNSK